ncbi:Hypothetical protein KFL_010190020 [Klebsormidium nitens]|uniref:DUF5899 domain-containing protein n=1 Tax=Klebsormidium nitens TaxID=105231 RepID=A0A1Y1INL7_KLENI|nr:Hypothetical protein KFL_010190020 [Klebsormidium nitens]|eukprot:GAQ92460.1 Hypothetical protein KFL_010190020 [Klebsormidium nitens]
MNSGQVRIKYALEQAVIQSTKPGEYFLSPLPTPANSPCPYDDVDSGLTCTSVYPDRPGIDVDSRLRGLFRETVKPGLAQLPPTSTAEPRRRMPVRGMIPPIHRFRQSQRGDTVGIESKHMELAIIGGLATLGLLNFERKQRTLEEPVPEEYRLPEDARYIYDPRHAHGMNSMENPRVSMYLQPNAFCQPNVSNFDSIQGVERACVDAMSAHAVPLREERRAAGVDVVRGPVKMVRFGDGAPTAPFFRSSKSQFHSDANSRSRIESFTGSDPLGHRDAHEPPGALFKPTPNVNTGANMVDARDAQLEHITVSAFRNNEAPLQSQIVGPGIGLPPDAPPSGGFHPFLRIMPDNVGQYRNNLPGGLIVGGQPITEGPTRYDAVPSHKAPKTSMDVGRKRPGVATSAPYVGKMLRPDVLSTMQEQSRSVPITNLPGPPGRSDASATIQRFDTWQRDGRPRNVDPNAFFASSAGVNYAGVVGPGGYADGTNTHRAGKREVLLGDHGFANMASAVGEEHIGSIGEMVRPRTLRQVSDSYTKNALSINASRHTTAAAKGEVRDGAVLRSTLRSKAVGEGYAGNPVGAHTRQVKRDWMGEDGRKVRQTERATLGDTSYAGNKLGPNPRGPNFGRVELPPPRADRSQGPGPQARLTGMMSAATIGGDTRHKPPGLVTREGLPTDQRVAYSRELGELTSYKQPAETPHSRFSDLEMAKRQLANNPYALSITDVYSGRKPTNG